MFDVSSNHYRRLPRSKKDLQEGLAQVAEETQGGP